MNIMYFHIYIQCPQRIQLYLKVETDIKPLTTCVLFHVVISLPDAHHKSLLCLHLSSPTSDNTLMDGRQVNATWRELMH